MKPTARDLRVAEAAYLAAAEVAVIDDDRRAEIRAVIEALLCQSRAFEAHAAGGDEVSTHGMVARFDGMAWPFPCEEMSEIGWRLRYGDATLARSDALRAAEIISAYCALVAAPERKRRHVVRNLRKAMEVTP